MPFQRGARGGSTRRGSRFDRTPALDHNRFPNKDGSDLALYATSPLFRVPTPDRPHVVSAALSSSVPSGQDSYLSGNTVTFNEAVAVNTSSGTPKLPLRIGHNLRAAAYTPIDSIKKSPLTTSRKFPSIPTYRFTTSAATGASKCM